MSQPRLNYHSVSQGVQEALNTDVAALRHTKLLSSYTHNKHILVYRLHVMYINY